MARFAVQRGNDIAIEYRFDGSTPSDPHVEIGTIPAGENVTSINTGAGTYETTPIAGTVEQVKAEANRRILEIVPEWKQRNLLAQAAQLNRKPVADWTAEEQAAVDAGDAVWAQVQAIRAKSDEIEAMNPIPFNLADDSLWG